MPRRHIYSGLTIDRCITAAVAAYVLPGHVHADLCGACGNHCCEWTGDPTGIARHGGLATTVANSSSQPKLVRRLHDVAKMMKLPRDSLPFLKFYSLFASLFGFLIVVISLSEVIVTPQGSSAVVRIAPVPPPEAVAARLSAITTCKSVASLKAQSVIAGGHIICPTPGTTTASGEFRPLGSLRLFPSANW
jgi:hypothetical protein